jgi:DNA-binding NtrC family response regulator
MALVAVFLEKCYRLMGRSPMTISRRALEALEQYAWPGNVRELENLVERLVALTEGDVIHIEDLPIEVCGQGVVSGDICLDLTEQGMDMVAAIVEIERRLISQALVLAGGVKARAAALLGINRTTLVEKMRRMGMSVPE